MNGPLPSLFTVIALSTVAANAQGRFRELVREHTPREDALHQAVALGDVDADGDVDAVFGRGSGQLRLYRNDGHAVFAVENIGPSSISVNAQALRLVDLDGDSDLDLVIGRRNGAALIYLNDGAGTFTDATAGRLPSETPVNAVASLWVLDVEPDGDPDLLIGSSSATGLYLNDGLGFFSSVSAGLPEPDLRASGAAIADFDGDQHVDVLLSVALLADDRYRLWRNDGHGGFVDASANLPLAAGGLDRGAASVVAGDADGDGDPDAVLGGYSGFSEIYLNDGTGRFTAAPPADLPLPYFAELHTRYSDLLLDDLDADGDLDLIAFGSPTGRFVLQNDGQGRFSRVEATRLPQRRGGRTDQALADLDGDGDLDLVEAYASSGGSGSASGVNAFYLNDGDATFRDGAGTSIQDGVDDATAMLAADLTGDGYPDLVVASDHGSFDPLSYVRVYLNDRSGEFFELDPLDVPSFGGTVRALAAGDVDGDGDEDLYVGRAGPRDELLVNDGAAGFTPIPFPALTESTSAAAFVDVDGDGDQDLVTVEEGLSGQVARDHVWINDGSGNFQDGTSSHAPGWVLPQASEALAVLDVDVDGAPDLLIGIRGTATGSTRLWMNDGAGHFRDETFRRMPIDPAVATESIAAGDVDGHGTVDLVLAGGTPRVYLNNGLGYFVDVPSAIPAGGSYASVVGLCDADLDGDLDIVVGASQLELLSNDGSGTFTVESGALPSSVRPGRCVRGPRPRRGHRRGVRVPSRSTPRLRRRASDPGAVARPGGDGVPGPRVRRTGERAAAVLRGRGRVVRTRRPALAALRDPEPRSREHHADPGRRSHGDRRRRDQPVRAAGSRSRGRRIHRAVGLRRPLQLGDPLQQRHHDARALMTRVTMEPRVQILLSGVAAAASLVLAVPAQTAIQFAERIPGFALGATANDSQTVTLGDVDGDGDVDAVVGNGDGSTSTRLSFQDRLYLNDGTGLFRDATDGRLPASTGTTAQNELTDVDADGDLDLLVAAGSGLGLNLRLWINDGQGTFTDESSLRGLPQLLDYVTGFASADVDGDGDADLLAAARGVLTLFLNDGAGYYFATAGRFQSVSLVARCLAVADVDGDGDVDLAVGQSTQSAPQYTWLFRNDGTGHFGTDPRWIAPTRDFATTALRFADLDNDGDPDLIEVHDTAPDTIEANVGGVFVPFPNDGLPLENTTSHDAAAFDVDADGDLDLLFAISGQPSRLFLNDGTAHFTRAPSVVFDGATYDGHGVAVADLDGDGHLDVFQANGGPNGIWFGDGAGGLVDTLPADVAPSALTGRAIGGDLDGDGDRDLVLLDHDATLDVLFNDGLGRFTQHVMNLPALSLLVPALGDVDGDGDLDLLVGSGSQDFIYRNPGDGHFESSTAELLTTTSLYHDFATFADLDADGDQDLIVTTGYQNRLFLNDGTGAFTESIDAFTRFGGTYGLDTGHVAIGDIDQDGDLDVVFDDDDSQARIFVNDGHAVFADETALRMPRQSSCRGVALGDADGDGDLDLTFGKQYSGTSVLLANDGAGVFTVATGLPAGSRVAGSMFFRDVDADGDLDLVGVAQSRPTEVLINDGSGTFTDQGRLASELSDFQSGDVADFDGDGDADLLVSATYAPPRLFRNLQRQVMAPSAPRTGAAFTVRVFSEPGYATVDGVAVLLMSSAAAAVPLELPPLGAIRLDPAGLLFFATLPIAAAADSADFVVPVPPDAALIGIDVWYQGATLRGSDLAELRFTNLGVEGLTR